MKKTAIILIFILIFASNSSFIAAASWDKKEANENSIRIEGNCQGKETTIYLYTKDSKNIIYSAGTKCENGKFYFEDDLAKWNIPSNSYNVVVGEGQNNPDFTKVERVFVTREKKISPKFYDIETVAVEFPSVDWNTKFVRDSEDLISDLDGLSTSVDDMKETLEKTTKPEPVKLIFFDLLTKLETAIHNLQAITNNLQALISQPEKTPPANVTISPDSNNNTSSSDSADTVDE